MRSRRELFACTGRGLVLASLLACSAGVLAAQQPSHLEASVFTWDGKDFVRSETTLMTESGASAVNTKLDHGTQAYKALSRKHSFEGDVTVFGKQYHAHYAPIIGTDGRMTGALFVATAR
jgi:hypothetical protein